MTSTATVWDGAREWRQLPVVLSYGMGVDSTALLLRWILDETSRDFDLADLIVLVAQTGDEHADTGRLVETYILPLLRKHRIRFVEVARGGHSQSDGIVVLQDTRAPRRLHLAGHYKLSDELLRNGSVPQFGGEHRCSLKFKAFVLEAWLKREFAGAPHRHAFGYNADETARVDKSRAAMAARYRVAFGFNADEPERVERSRQYDEGGRLGDYPLADWGWGREFCEDYIELTVGERWEKSACVECPFVKLTPHSLTRMRNHAAQVARALMLEHLSLSLNPRGTLYKKRSLREVVEADGNLAALARFERDLAAHEWAVYRVRRVYTAKGRADRCVQVIRRGARADMVGGLEEFGPTDEARHIRYAYRRRRIEGRYPTVEELFVAAPAVVEEKARYGVGWFEGRWAAAVEAEAAMAADVGRAA